MTPHKNRLGETVLMMGHYIRFKGLFGKIIPKLSLLLLLIWSTGLARHHSPLVFCLWSSVVCQLQLNALKKWAEEDQVGKHCFRLAPDSSKNYKAVEKKSVIFLFYS